MIHNSNFEELKIPHKKWRDRPPKIFSDFISILLVIFLAIVFRSLCYEPFHISSGSMKNSLLIGDFILTSKYSYGYSKYSLPFNLPIISKRILYKAPKRGDIVLFRPPNDPYKHYVKRVIGLPGDKIQLRQGVIYINGVKIKKELLRSYSNENNILLNEYEETLPNGKVYNVLETNKNDILLNTSIYEIPENCFFMLGDNRNSSKDSRFLKEIGYISKENLVGKASIILLSVDTKHAPFVRINRLCKFLN